MVSEANYLIENITPSPLAYPASKRSRTLQPSLSIEPKSEYDEYLMNSLSLDSSIDGMNTPPSAGYSDGIPTSHTNLEQLLDTSIALQTPTAHLNFQPMNSLSIQKDMYLQEGFQLQTSNNDIQQQQQHQLPTTHNGLLLEASQCDLLLPPAAPPNHVHQCSAHSPVMTTTGSVTSSGNHMSPYSVSQYSTNQQQSSFYDAPTLYASANNSTYLSASTQAMSSYEPVSLATGSPFVKQSGVNCSTFSPQLETTQQSQQFQGSLSSSPATVPFTTTGTQYEFKRPEVWLLTQAKCQLEHMNGNNNNS